MKNTYKVLVEATSEGRSYTIAVTAVAPTDAKAMALAKAKSEYPQFRWNKTSII